MYFVWKWWCIDINRNKIPENNELLCNRYSTDVGKTIVSAVLAEAIQADYWKPIQCGGLEYTDTQRVKTLFQIPKHVFWRELLFQKSLITHAAAKLENTEIDINNIILPQTPNNLIVEGAGGLMVPLNSNFLMIDLIKNSSLPLY